MPTGRLDILFYAHDGRGLGHASRAMALAMAARRLAPQARLLLVSGSRGLDTLAAGSGVDWVKLPSYATRVVAGVSTGAPGESGLGDAELGDLRTAMLADLAGLLRPRVFYADHSPQGKHRELLGLLDRSREAGTHCVLGVRAVVGGVDKVWSPLAASIFRDHYDDLVWFGDPAADADEERARLAAQFAREPFAAGYASRMAELLARGLVVRHPGPPLSGTVSVPWLGPRSGETLAQLAQALRLISEGNAAGGGWRVFAGGDGSGAGGTAMEALEQVPGVTVLPTGPEYPEALAASRLAVIHGGYNSLGDVMALGVPALVLTRGMRDGEQAAHAVRLAALWPGLAVLDEETATARDMAAALSRLATVEPGPAPVRLDGAELAARRLLDHLTKS